MKIDHKKFEDTIALRIHEAAQNLVECKCADCGARHRLAGRIAGLADILDDLYRNWGKDDEELMSIVFGEATYRQAEADDATDIRVVRYDTEAARVITEVSEEAADGMWVAENEEAEKAWAAVEEVKSDYEKAKEDLAKEPEAGGSGDSDEDIPTFTAVVDTPRKKAYIPRTPVDTILVWSYRYACSSEGENSKIPMEDLAIEFYLKDGRSERQAHAAALNAVYSMEKRNLAEIVRTGSKTKNGRPTVDFYRLTTHGIFEAQRLIPPEVSDDHAEAVAEIEKAAQEGAYA